MSARKFYACCDHCAEFDFGDGCPEEGHYISCSASLDLPAGSCLEGDRVLPTREQEEAFTELTQLTQEIENNPLSRDLPTLQSRGKPVVPPREYGRVVGRVPLNGHIPIKDVWSMLDEVEETIRVYDLDADSHDAAMIVTNAFGASTQRYFGWFLSVEDK